MALAGSEVCDEYRDTAFENTRIECTNYNLSINNNIRVWKNNFIIIAGRRREDTINSNNNNNK